MNNNQTYSNCEAKTDTQTPASCNTQTNEIDNQDLFTELELRPFTQDSPEYQDVYDLYYASFPKSERKPMEMIIASYEDGRMDTYSAFYQGKLAGLVFLVNGAKADILDYLAIHPQMRSAGIGSKLLAWLKANRKRPFIVEIESTISSEDEIPKRRKDFYLRNGMIDCHQEISLFGVDMELLSSPIAVTYEQYYQVLASYLSTFPEMGIDYKKYLYPIQH